MGHYFQEFSLIKPKSTFKNIGPKLSGDVCSFAKWGSSGVIFSPELLRAVYSWTMREMGDSTPFHSGGTLRGPPGKVIKNSTAETIPYSDIGQWYSLANFVQFESVKTQLGKNTQITF